LVENGKIRARIYTPESEGPYPTIVYFHGGGWMLGSIDSQDPICRDLCVKSNRVVVSVDYRLAPEHPFPTAPNDCMTALEWVIQNIDNLNGDIDQIYVAGDSAGGNLAAVLSLESRIKHPGLIKGQILIYPVTDHYRASVNQGDSCSYSNNLEGLILTKDLMIWFWDQYLKNSKLLKSGQTQHELATPLSVDDLSSLPPALILIADRDPLKDEAIAYAKKLVLQGNDVTYTLYEGTQHGFMGSMGPTRNYEKACAQIIKWLDDV